MKRFAEAISFIFHFLFIAPLSIALIMREYPITTSLWSWLYPLLLILSYYLSPMLIVILFRRMHLVSDFDVTDRRERNLLNAVIFIVIFSTSALLLFTPVPDVYKFNNAFTILFALTFGIVTYFWKISYHMGALAWFLGTIFLVYGVSTLTVSFAVVLAVAMAWSRIYLNKHTLFQTIAGLSLSGSLYYLLYIFIL